MSLDWTICSKQLGGTKIELVTGVSTNYVIGIISSSLFSHNYERLTNVWYWGKYYMVLYYVYIVLYVKGKLYIIYSRVYYSLGRLVIKMHDNNEIGTCFYMNSSTHAINTLYNSYGNADSMLQLSVKGTQQHGI